MTVFNASTSVRCCGSCKRWVPEESNMVLRAKNKYLDSYCLLTGEPREARDEKGCLAWIPKQNKLEGQQ